MSELRTIKLTLTALSKRQVISATQILTRTIRVVNPRTSAEAIAWGGDTDLDYPNGVFCQEILPGGDDSFSVDQEHKKRSEAWLDLSLHAVECLSGAVPVNVDVTYLEET